MSLELIETVRILRLKPEQGWPETFTADDATKLQSWQPDTKAWRLSCTDLRNLFREALKAGSVEVRTETKRVLASPARDVMPPSFGFGTWPDSFTRDGVWYAYTEPARYKDQTTHHLSARAFAAWLDANNLEASRHVSAWFKSQGVAAAPAAALAPPKPTTETIAERGKRWLLVWHSCGGPNRPGAQAEAIKRIATAEGVKPDTVKKALQKAESEHKAAYREGGVSPIGRTKNKPATAFSGLMKKR